MLPAISRGYEPITSSFAPGGIDWVQDPNDPKQGEALIKLCELPPEFGLERLKAERPGEPVNRSPGRQEWLPDVDSNHGHGDASKEEQS